MLKKNISIYIEILMLMYKKSLRRQSAIKEYVDTYLSQNYILLHI